jgi:hypothetical protein
METDTSKSQYEQTANDEELVEEDIDPRILKLLGLEDVFDFEYGEYKTLIREKLTELDMKAAQKPADKKTSQNQAVLIDEFKRVKRNKGKFKLKSKAVKAEKVVNKSKTSKAKPITDASKLLPGSGGAIQPYKKIKSETPKPEQEENKEKESKEDLSDFFKNLLDSLKGIGSVVKDLVGILNKQLGVDRKNAENRRKEGEKTKAKQEEKDLEKQEKDKGSGILEKITKPFTSIFDTIRNFLLNVLLGSIVMWLLKVIKNPMILLKPIQGLVDGIVGFFNNVIKFIDFMVVQPVRSFIDMINSALKGFIDILNGALKMLPGSPQLAAPQAPNIPEPPQIQSPDITGEKKQQQAPSGPPIQLKFGGGPITPIKSSESKKLSFNDKVSSEGGIVNSQTAAYDIEGLGQDKRLTALSDGEYVLKGGAADWLGGPAYLDSINKMFGGSSKRNVASLGDVKIQAANEGGTIGFDPDLYIKGSNQTSINVGSGAASKRYTVAYKKEGSGNFTVKQINKVVQGAGLGGLSMLLGARDQLTGVKPSSQEGKMVINSVALSQHFKSESGGNIGKLVGPIKVNVDPQADIYWAYKQAYNTTYEKWMKQGAPPEKAREYARRAGADFAIARKGASQLPGSKEGLDVALKQVDVPGGSSSYSSSSSAAPSSVGISDFAANYKVLGDPARAGYVPPGSKKDESKKESGNLAKSILDNKSGTGNPPGALAPGQRPDKLGLSGAAKDKFVAEKVMAVGTSPAMVMPPDKPKQNIPQPPSNKPTIAALPLPAKNQTPMMTGSSNGGSNNQTVFSSFREDEATLAVVASIYNMWGGL